MIRAITLHPNFNATTKDHNLAVLRTTFDINLQPGLVEAARVAGAAYSFVETVPVTAIGWGDGMVN
jgi:hypothetical protein